ncbi:MAG: DUF1036 domain-containing protein [Alphaproteobacteria bacterium]|nr:DUF1036 domain-containing protein [Alphaproteobacteria bacterium]
MARERMTRALAAAPLKWLARLCLPLGFACWATSASAGLTLCNKTPYTVHTAVAFFLADPPGTTTNGHRGGLVDGWQKILPGECKLVSRQVARAGEFYYHAKTVPNGTHVWEGRGQLCVSHTPFHDTQLFLMGDRRCRPGFYPAGFHATRQVNTIEQRVNLTLSD